jgi:hypothetical protein
MQQRQQNLHPEWNEEVSARDAAQIERHIGPGGEREDRKKSVTLYKIMKRM